MLSLVLHPPAAALAPGGEAAALPTAAAGLQGDGAQGGGAARGGGGGGVAGGGAMASPLLAGLRQKLLTHHFLSSLQAARAGSAPSKTARASARRAALRSFYADFEALAGLVVWRVSECGGVGRFCGGGGGCVSEAGRRVW